MHIISKKPFIAAARQYPNDAAAINRTYKVLTRGDFRNPDELRKIFSTLDNFRHKDQWWVIDIAGNNLRLIAFIRFRDNRMYVKHIVNHTEYDKLCKRYAKEAD